MIRCDYSSDIIPTSLDGSGRRSGRPIANQDLLDPDVDVSTQWAGEVVEIDETNSRIYVAVADVDHPPVRGSFYIRPFEFLARSTTRRGWPTSSRS